MKKLIIILSAFSLLTACGDNKNTFATAQQSSEVAEEIMDITEDTTKSRRERNVYVDIDDTQRFESLEEFVDHVESDNLNDDFEIAHYADTGEQVIHENFTPLIPKYDETKYELTHVKFNVSCYDYYFNNLSVNHSVNFCISYDTEYHTFEELVEVSNMNLWAEVENIDTTVWNDTPALVQSVPFSDPTSYSIQAMIDENNSIYLSMENMTPYELTACLNEFTFE